MDRDEVRLEMRDILAEFRELREFYRDRPDAQAVLTQLQLQVRIMKLGRERGLGLDAWRYCVKDILPKSQWGDGPWQQERDELEWRETKSRYRCLMMRADGGSWCGYVQLPEDHPLVGTKADDIDVSVHGGVTWAKNRSPCLPPVRDTWWVGFDCAQSGDFQPAMAAKIQQAIEEEIEPRIEACLERFELNDVYRDKNYVVAECESLAQQLLELA